MTHFANKYIGCPWVAGAQGPDSFDCWGFVRFVLLHEYGYNVPPVNINPDNVDKPQDGDVVLMRQAKNPVHAGLWLDIDGGGILHCVRGSGVVFQNIASLNLSGWFIDSFYRVKNKQTT